MKASYLGSQYINFVRNYYKKYLKLIDLTRRCDPSMDVTLIRVRMDLGIMATRTRDSILVNGPEL